MLVNALILQFGMSVTVCLSEICCTPAYPEFTLWGKIVTV